MEYDSFVYALAVTKGSHSATVIVYLGYTSYRVHVDWGKSEGVESNYWPPLVLTYIPRVCNYARGFSTWHHICLACYMISNIRLSHWWISQQLF